MPEGRFRDQTRLSQNQEILNENAANLRVAQINPWKFAKFAHSPFSRSKTADLSGDFEKTMDYAQVSIRYWKQLYNYFQHE